MPIVVYGNIYASTKETSTYTEERSIENIDLISEEYIHLIVDNKLWFNVRDLSYHNFEKIEDFSHIGVNIERTRDDPISIFSSKLVWKCKLKGYDSLLSFHNMDKYSIPTNSKQRGGKRCIFNSPELSKFLGTLFIPDTDYYDEKLADAITFTLEQNPESVLTKKIFKKLSKGSSEYQKYEKNRELNISDEPYFFNLSSLNNQGESEEEESDDEEKELKICQYSRSRFKCENEICSKCFCIDHINLCDYKLENGNLCQKRKIDHSKCKEHSDMLIVDGFHGINNVFRLNCFSPEDSMFKVHFDTPFVDEANMVFSKYTILIYLSSGENREGILGFETLNGTEIITNVEAGDVFIFDQQLRHWGKPFEFGDKIFIRSEILIKHLEYCEKTPQMKFVAKVFNEACYFQAQAIIDRNPDFQQISTDLFDLSARIRNGEEVEYEDSMLLCKYNGFSFVTTGSRYFFKLENVSKDNLKILAAIVILDYFNGSLKDRRINILKKLINSSDPFEILNIVCFDENPELSQDSSFLYTDTPDELIKECTCGMGDSKTYREYLFHQLKDILITSGVIGVFSSFVNIENIRVKKNKIILSDRFKQINFASCNCESNFEDNTETLSVVKMVTFPDLPYSIIDNYVIIDIDVWKNGFIFKENAYIFTLTRNEEKEDVYIPALTRNEEKENPKKFIPRIKNCKDGFMSDILKEESRKNFDSDDEDIPKVIKRSVSKKR